MLFRSTIEYVKGRPLAPTGEAWDKAVAHWRTLKSDDGAKFDKVVELAAASIEPQGTWGTSPEMVTGGGGKVQIRRKRRIRSSAKGWSAR